MKKEDAPRLKRFLGTIMRMELGRMTGKDMLQLVRDMEWLADEVEALEKPPKEMEILKSTPIEDKEIKSSKSKKKK